MGQETAPIEALFSVGLFSFLRDHFWGEFWQVATIKDDVTHRSVPKFIAPVAKDQTKTFY